MFCHCKSAVFCIHSVYRWTDLESFCSFVLLFFLVVLGCFKVLCLYLYQVYAYTSVQ